jgi:hypothetical protein
MIIDIDYEIGRATKYFRDKAKKEGRKPLSRLFMVLDHGGGWRIVVTRKWEIRYHVAQGEKAIEVPKVRIAEPVEWDDIGRTITLVERYATKTLAGQNACGGCKTCCTLLHIEHPKLHKPANASCTHLDSCTAGCRIYPVRPDPCREFECEWLISQRLNDKMPAELRPDRCGVMFVKGMEPMSIVAKRDFRWDGNPYASEAVKDHIAALEQFGMKVVRDDPSLSH